MAGHSNFADSELNRTSGVLRVLDGYRCHALLAATSLLGLAAAATSATFNDHFPVSFEAINLTDEYVDQYIDSAADRLSVFHHTGRQFYFGARYKY